MTTSTLQRGTSVSHQPISSSTSKAKSRPGYPTLKRNTCFADAVQKRRFVTKASILLVLLAALVWGLILLNDMPWWLFKLLLFVFGWFVWTIVEYVYHRFVVHGIRSSSNFTTSDENDQFPGLAERIITAVASAISIWLAFSEQPLYALLAGFTNAISLACYYRIFLQWEDFSKLAPALYRNRLYHTSGGTDKAFGWSTVMWDKYFDTYVPSGIVHARQPGKPLDSVSTV